MDIRNDKGTIWENVMLIERQTYLAYNEISNKNYFWRRYSGAEIDLVEQRDVIFYAFKFKWKAEKGLLRNPEGEAYFSKS